MYNSYKNPFLTNSNTPQLTGGQYLAAFLLVVIAYLIVSFVLSKVFAKAKKPEWAAFVPIYNYWVLFEISGKPGWWALTMILAWIPVIGQIIGWIPYVVLFVLAMLGLGKKFNKTTVFSVFGLIIFSIVGWIMIGFGDAKYNPKA